MGECVLCITGMMPKRDSPEREVNYNLKTALECSFGIAAIAATACATIKTANGLRYRELLKIQNGLHFLHLLSNKVQHLALILHTEAFFTMLARAKDA